MENYFEAARTNESIDWDNKLGKGFNGQFNVEIVRRMRDKSFINIVPIDRQIKGYRGLIIKYIPIQ